MRLFFAFIFISMIVGTGEAERLWVNNITINEYNMSWNYTEIFTGIDSIIYRMNIDKELGNNDSFISAWELLNADKVMRKRLRSSIDSELDVRINNKTAGIEVAEIDSSLSPQIIGKTHLLDIIVNKYNAVYRFNDSILNASSIWFLGQAKTQVTIIMPAGVDVVNISGMDNVTKNITDHTEITGLISEISKDRGEINLSLARNASAGVYEINISNITSSALVENTTENITESNVNILSMIRDAGIIGAGIIMIILILIFKVR